MNRQNDDIASPDQTLFPDQILQGYTLTEPGGYITVRGTVKRLTPFADKYIYGEIRGIDHEISFRCPSGRAPTAKHQAVILGGYLKVKPAKMHNGLAVELQGEVIGSWDGITLNQQDVICPERESAKTPLSLFLKNQRKRIPDILVVGTKRGILDYQTPIKQEIDIPWNEKIINVTNTTKFLSEMESLISSRQPSAIAIVRGGADSDKSMSIWSDAKIIDFLLNTGCAIYTAIGHADGLVVLDQYADQSFISPTDLGHCLVNALKRLETDDQLARKYHSIAQDNDSLNERVTEMEFNYTQKIQAIEKEHLTSLSGLKSHSRLMMLIAVTFGTTLLLLTGFMIFRFFSSP